MHSFAEAAFQSGGEGNAVLAELVADVIHRGEGFSPTIGFVFYEEVKLALARFQAGSVDAEQPDLCLGFAIFPEQGADLAEDFGIELGGVIERMGARDG